MSAVALPAEQALRLSFDWTSGRGSTAFVTLPHPAALPSRRSDVAIAVTDIFGGADLATTFDDSIARATLRLRLWAREQVLAACALPGRAGETAEPSATHGAPSGQAEAEQAEHDRYFQVMRSAGSPADGFAAALLLAHLAAHQICLDMGVTLLAEPEWGQLFAGLQELMRVAGCEPAAAGQATGSSTGRTPALPSPTGRRTGYDPGKRWLVGHQLFFSLIQGAIVGLNCFASAMAGGQTAEADEGLRFAAAFMLSSAAAMKLASDFAPSDYERTVRPAMAPPKVRAGFSGLQTRDHAYLVRLFGTLKPLFLELGRSSEAHGEFVESVVSAYEAHEFICARFRGDVLPSLRMEASSRGKTERAGTAVIREMMRARLGLVDPVPSSAAADCESLP